MKRNFYLEELNLKSRLKIRGILMALVVLVGALAPAATVTSAQDALSGTLTVAGSTSVQPIAEMLAEEFQTQNPGVKINVQGGGSSAGVKAAQTGAAQIGMSSRELKENEKSLHETVVARDGIAIIVHPKNKVSNLTVTQIQAIFAGKITNWKEIGGKNAPIRVVIREAGSGTRGAFEEMVMGKVAVTERAIVQGSTGAVRQTVSGDPDAIGYISFDALGKEVKSVKVAGVEAKAQNIKNGSYKIARPFLFLTREEPTGLVKAFIDFVLSERGQAIIAQEGLVRVK
ncbi:MAG: phosphate ABC transporter substrate-binding protein [Syntrophothermus sp.]